MIKEFFILIVLLAHPFYGVLAAEAPGFAECFDHGNEGREPLGAPRTYQILGPAVAFPHPSLKAVQSSDTHEKRVFRLIIEDVRFTSYKCWDRDKNLTGFDIEMMTQAAHEAGYQYIEFIPRAWSNVEYEGQAYPSLLVDLIHGLGDGVSAGMSITPDREALVHMVGPIYKAGKKLMARNDNPRIGTTKAKELLQVPSMGYEALRGLSVLVQSSTIRSEFFIKLAEAHPDLVTFARLNEQNTAFELIADEATRLVVFEVDAAALESYIDQHMTGEIYGRSFDLVMLDTGSTEALRTEGKLGVDTKIVTGNLGADPLLGSVFGRGDGVSFTKESQLIELFEPILAKMIRVGRINALVEKWFRDENAADHGWTNMFHDR